MRPEDMVPVVSSFIAAVGYDNIQNILHVQFKSNGSIQKYQGVPPELYQSMMSADSIGSFYTKNIKGVIKSDSVEGGGNV